MEGGGQQLDGIYELLEIVKTKCNTGPGFTKGLKFRQFFCLDKS